MDNSISKFQHVYKSYKYINISLKTTKYSTFENIHWNVAMPRCQHACALHCVTRNSAAIIFARTTYLNTTDKMAMYIIFYISMVLHPSDSAQNSLSRKRSKKTEASTSVWRSTSSASRTKPTWASPLCRVGLYRQTMQVYIRGTTRSHSDSIVSCSFCY